MNKKLSITFVAPIILALSIPSAAMAGESDLFLSDSDNHYGSYASEIRKTREKADASLNYTGARAELPVIEEKMKKRDEFKGPIERLLRQAGEDPAAATNNWRDFESVDSDQKAQENYYNSSEFKVRQELSRPIGRRNPFGDKLGDIENTIGNLKRKEVDIETQYGEKSKYAPRRP